MREAREESGLEVGDPEYVGSTQIDDYRYPKSGSDRIMTSFFTVRYLFGAAVAADDISEVEWFPAASLPALVEAHWPLGLMFRTHFFGAFKR
jgi:bifunctional NMN adenylyltransferase/nudix hydrolase